MNTGGQKYYMYRKVVGLGTQAGVKLEYRRAAGLQYM